MKGNPKYGVVMGIEKKSFKLEASSGDKILFICCCVFRQKVGQFSQWHIDGKNNYKILICFTLSEIKSKIFAVQTSKKGHPNFSVLKVKFM